MKLYQHFDCKFEALGVEIEGWHNYKKKSAILILWGTGCKKISEKSIRFGAFLQNPKMQKMRKKFWKMHLFQIWRCKSEDLISSSICAKNQFDICFQGWVVDPTKSTKIDFSIFALSAEPIELCKKQKLFWVDIFKFFISCAHHLAVTITIFPQLIFFSWNVPIFVHFRPQLYTRIF